MKKIKTLSIFLLVSGFLFTSCSKSDDDTSSAPVAQHKSALAFLKSPEGSSQFAKAMSEYFDKNPRLKSSEFMVPIFSGDGVFVGKDLVFDWETFTIISGEIGGWSASYSPNDFWRVNNDGSISIHLNSNNATGDHYNFATNVESWGDNGHLAVDYTGYLIEITFIDPVTGEVYVFYFIDTSNSNQAMTLHGNGKVQENGTGPKQNLVVHATITSSQQGSIWMTLN